MNAVANSGKLRRSLNSRREAALQGPTSSTTGRAHLIRYSIRSGADWPGAWPIAGRRRGIRQPPWWIAPAGSRSERWSGIVLLGRRGCCALTRTDMPTRAMMRSHRHAAFNACDKLAHLQIQLITRVEFRLYPSQVGSVPADLGTVPRPR